MEGGSLPFWRIAVVAGVLLGSCTSGPSPGTSPTVQPSPQTEPPESGAVLATGQAVPATCDPVPSSPSEAGVAFVAGGSAWAVRPDGSELACLFSVGDPGPFAWGPLGDRVVLSGLEIREQPDTLIRPPGSIELGPLSWGHPEGKAVVFVGDEGDSLEKALLGQKNILEISPFRKATYLNVTYHPSGLAVAFAVERKGEQSIWMASNLGEQPRRLVFTEENTRFGALSFDGGGRYLFYAAQHADGHPELHRLDLTTLEIPVFWEGEGGEEVRSVAGGFTRSEVAFDVGTSCDESVAMVQAGRKAQAVPALPDEEGPTRTLGWLSEHNMLVAAGPCAGPVDVWVVGAQTGEADPVVYGVDAGAVRAPQPSPANLPPLPEVDIEPGAA